ncbi:MAG: sugar phosphate isomerase/epimerase [Desulfomonile tiedjei]|nr:sugar phosphate isomerase/epimerase [Desulfomonile tiedjei]
MLFGGHVRTADDVPFLQALGFDFGEVAITSAGRRTYWLETGLKNRFESGFFLLAHGPREGPPNDVDNLWNNYLPALKETIDVAGTMEIPLLTVHLWVDPRFVKAVVRAEKKKLLREAFEYGRYKKVLVSLENLSENSADLAEMVEAVPDLSITLDVGHAQLLTDVNTSFGIIDELFPSIKHLHLHDNSGGNGVKDDLHLPIGEGIIDFPAILGRLMDKGYEGTATLELEREVLASSRAALNVIMSLTER